MSARVFLSYASQDAALAQRLATDLRDAALQVWLDQWDLKVGEEFARGIERGIDEADFVIVLLTPSSVASDWVRREWSRKFLCESENTRVAIVPVRGKPCEIPDFLAQRSHADISGGGYQPGLRRLLEIISHHSARGASDAVVTPILDVDPNPDLIPVVTPIALEVGADLIPLVGDRPDGSNPFLDECVRMREALAAELGFFVPGVRIRGNELEMPAATALVMIEEVPETMIRVDPREADAAAQLISGLAAVVRRHAAEFVDIDLAHWLVEGVDPELVARAVPAIVSWIDLADVLRRLVAENVNIANLGPILAQFTDGVPAGCDSVTLAEHARHALAPQLTARLVDERGEVSVFRLAAAIESQVRGAIQRTSSGAYFALDPDHAQAILAAVGRAVAGRGDRLSHTPILTATDIRVFVRKLVDLDFPSLAVISDQDLVAGTVVRTIGEVQP